MFRFEDPIYLYLLAVIPLLAIIRWLMIRQQKKRLRRFGDLELVRELMPDVSRFRPLVKFVLLLAALALLIVMIARPQFGTKISHEKRTGIETIIAMDISNSMLAEDVTPSRLDRSKMMVENLVDNFTNDKIGLIVFAGDAFIQLPITSDYVSAKMFLSSIDPSMIATQGTDIATAISMASRSFTQQEGVGKAIIVITDGEDHEGGALDAAKEAKSRGHRVYVLGVGSPKGAPIPTGDGDYMKDIVVNGNKYEIIEERGERNLKEDLEKYLTNYFDYFDYILCDYSYDRVRIKGFCDSSNKMCTPINNINTKDDYLKNLCAYEGDYFLLKRTK